MIHTADIKNWFLHPHLPHLAHSHTVQHHQAEHKPYYYVRQSLWVALLVLAFIAFVMLLIKVGPTGTGQLSNPARMKSVHRDIARVKTIMNEKVAGGAE